MKPSEIYLAAWMAAEKALPPEPMALIKAHDKLFDKWRKAGFPGTIPAALQSAADAIYADALASIAFKLRTQCNEASSKEWVAAQSEQSLPTTPV